jgi:hypothetical protein
VATRGAFVMGFVLSWQVTLGSRTGRAFDPAEPLNR